MKANSINMASLYSNKKMLYIITLAVAIPLLAISGRLAAQYNTAYGSGALAGLVTGIHNSAFGGNALYSNTSGYGNTANGSHTLFSNTIGRDNIAAGYYALYSNVTGNANAASGASALRYNINGDGNTANGHQALVSNVSGSYNTASGTDALFFNKEGHGNVAMGNRALYTNSTGSYNTAIGTYAFYSNTIGNYNTIVGAYANVAQVNLINATAIGAKAKVTASNTIQLGSDSVTKVYAGVGNAATLVAGGLQITGGTPAVGKVLTSNAIGVASWQIPAATGWGLTGNAGTIDGTHFIGTTDNAPLNIKIYNQKAGRIDAYNTFYGLNAGKSNTTGQYNVAIGTSALDRNNAGKYNVAIGYAASKDELNLTNTTAVGADTKAVGNSSTAIGAGARAMSDSSTAIGLFALVNTPNKIRLGNAAVTEVETQFKYTTVSDGRFKNNVKGEDIKGLEFIKKLHPVAYNFDTRKFQEHITQNMPADAQKTYMNQDFSASTAVRRSGFIAQEVEKAAQEVGYDFDGVSKPQGASGNYSLAYSQFVVPLVKGMQEQQTQIEQQEQKIDQLQQRLEALEKMIVGTNNSVLTKDALSKPTNNAIQVYPNPNNGVFNVVVPAGAQKMELMDMKGALLKTIQVDSKAASHPLNLTGYAKGIYMLQVVVNGKIQTTKIVVQ